MTKIECDKHGINSGVTAKGQYGTQVWCPACLIEEVFEKHGVELQLVVKATPETLREVTKTTR